MTTAKTGRQPLVGRDRQADFEAGTAHPDHLLGGNIRGDERGADRPPGERAFREKIVLRGGGSGFLLRVDPPPVAGDDEEIDEEDDVVGRMKWMHEMKIRSFFGPIPGTGIRLPRLRSGRSRWNARRATASRPRSTERRVASRS
jgi:hypothetical protein